MVLTLVEKGKNPRRGETVEVECRPLGGGKEPTGYPSAGCEVLATDMRQWLMQAGDDHGKTEELVDSQLMTED